ncbi:hypothetical protein BDZ89DRAFT_1131162 [Hymenopellis radicata]|nr:hypothetical protein BDZ89DRAFT_1131162 [Hymenopellis radicata]
MRTTTHKPYMERVIASMSTIQSQREKKKISIHIASIRADIKKTALANEEKLGPQWSKWVGTAIEKLVSEGLLKHTEAPGCVSFTAEGKKSSTAARQSIVTMDAPGMPLKSARVAQLVMKERAKRRSSAIHDANDEYTPRVKRPRRSMKGTPTLTKAELQAKLDELQRLYDALNTLRSSSPLTDLDEEDANEMQNDRLHDELQEKRQEIQRVRTELNILRDDGNETQYDAASSPAFTPSQASPAAQSRATDVTPSHARGIASALVRAQATTSVARGLMQGIIRTQSGTIIPQVSRQPTPPSSPGTQYESMDMDVPPIDIFERSDSSLTKQLAAAEKARVLLSDQFEELQSRKAAVEDALREAQAKQQCLTNETSNLRQQMLLQEATIKGLGVDMEGIQTEGATLMADLALATSKNSELLAAATQREQDLAKALADLSDANQVSSEHLQSLMQAQRQLTETTAAFTNIRFELDQKSLEIGELSHQVEHKEKELSDAMGLLDDARRDVDTLQESLSSKNHAYDTLRSEDAIRVQKLEAAAQELRSSCKAEAAKSSALQTALDDAHTSLTDLISQLTAKDDTRIQLEESLQAEAVRVASLEFDLGQVTMRAEKAEAMAPSFAAAKAEDEATIAHLKEIFSSYKASQIEGLTEIGNQVLSAGPSQSPLGNNM